MPICASGVLPNGSEYAVELHRLQLAVDVDALVAHDDVVARQADEPLDVVRRRIGRQAEHDDVAALRRAECDDLRVEHRQPQAVRELVDEDEVAVEQRRHHRVGRDAERLEQERADQQHDQDDREERACVLDDDRLARPRRPPHAAGVVPGTNDASAAQIRPVTRSPRPG